MGDFCPLDVSASGGSEARLGDPSADTGGAQVATEREDTRTGECDRDMNLQFSQQVRHRESTRTPDVQDAVTKLMQFRADQEIGTGRGVRGLVSERMKEVMRNFGETCGSVFHPTKHMQRGGQQTYVCTAVCSGGVSCRDALCEFNRDELAITIPGTRNHGLQHKCPDTVVFSRNNKDGVWSVNQSCSILDHHSD
jgi:hypothetical protein